MPSDGKIFLTTIPDLGNMGWGGNSNGDIAKYNELIKKVANDYSSKNVIYADINSVIDASKRSKEKLQRWQINSLPAKRLNDVPGINKAKQNKNNRGSVKLPLVKTSDLS